MGKIDSNSIRLLAKNQNIAFYSAKMVLKNKWTLDYALSLEKPVFNQGVRWLLGVKKKKWVMAFRTFERGIVLGKVLKVRKFNNLILSRGKLKYLEKIETAYVYNSKVHRLLPEYIRFDPFISDSKEKPAYKPSERKAVDLSLLKEQTPVRITLYTGEILEGLVTWVTAFDFELRMDRYLSILIFKHAVCEVSEKEYHRFKQPIRKRLPDKPYSRPKEPFRKSPSFDGPSSSGFGPTGFGPR